MPVKKKTVAKKTKPKKSLGAKVAQKKARDKVMPSRGRGHAEAVKSAEKKAKRARGSKVKPTEMAPKSGNAVKPKLSPASKGSRLIDGAKKAARVGSKVAKGAGAVGAVLTAYGIIKTALDHQDKRMKDKPTKTRGQRKGKKSSVSSTTPPTPATKKEAPSKNYSVGVSKGGVSFNEAFKHARNSGSKEFTWNGKKYNTKLKQ